MSFLSSKRINVHGTLDVIAASTNTTTRSWDLNVNVESSPAHINNNLKVQITRTTPGEKKLKVIDFILRLYYDKYMYTDILNKKYLTH